MKEPPSPREQIEAEKRAQADRAELLEALRDCLGIKSGAGFGSPEYLVRDLANVGPDWEARPFRGVALRMQVDLKPVWLEPNWQWFIGVKAPLSPQQCAVLITNPAWLNMCVDSYDRVDDTAVGHRRGAEFAYQQEVPPALPRVEGLTYFEMNRLTQPEVWKAVDRTKTLAMRLSPKLATGTIQGAEELTIVAPNKQFIPISFTLYVLRLVRPAPGTANR